MCFSGFVAVRLLLLGGQVVLLVVILKCTESLVLFLKCFYRRKNCKYRF